MLNLVYLKPDADIFEGQTKPEKMREKLLDYLKEGSDLKTKIRRWTKVDTFAKGIK
jgi:hypothetical protein